MILQKSFSFADLLLKKYFFLFSMLKTVVLLKIFVETDTFLIILEWIRTFKMYLK